MRTASLLAALAASASGVLSQTSPPPFVTIPGGLAMEHFGWSVAPAGDVNGDGVTDLIVGAPSSAAIAGFAGRAYLFHGPIVGPRSGATPDAVISATTFGDNLGFAVSSAGDVNGDGIDDVLVGARGNDGAGIQAGRCYVFFGPLHGALRDTDADVTISGRAFDEIGRAVAPAGDLDGDGRDDIVVGGPTSSPGVTSAGRAYVFYGPLAGSLSVTSADATIAGTQFNELLGTSLVAADLDGDGRDDLAAGAPRPPLNGAGTGRVYVFLGPVAGVRSAASADVTIVGESNNDEFGSALATGDVDGDGQADLVVGAEQFFTSSAGKAYVFLGPLPRGQLRAADAHAILVGESPGDHFGASVAAADIDGDGRDDVLVGADGSAAGGSLAGRGYVFLSPRAGSVPAATADLVLTGQVAEQLGFAVSALGDQDGNGLADFAVGAPLHPSVNAPGLVVVGLPPRAGVVAMAQCTSPQGTLRHTGGGPALGGTVALAMDGGQAAGAAAFLLLAAAPPAGWPPCGPVLPGVGELLVGTGPPPPVALPGGAWNGAPVGFLLPIPRGATLLGLPVFAQGAFVDPGSSVRLTGGLRLSLGL